MDRDAQDRKKRECAERMTRKTLAWRLPRGGLPLGAANHSGCSKKQAERVECCGNPIAESLWPTLVGSFPPGPFHRSRVHGRTALKKRSLNARILLRVPCNLFAASGLPVSACSLTLVLPGAIHPDLAGEMFETTALAFPTVPERHKRQT